MVPAELTDSFLQPHGHPPPSTEIASVDPCFRPALLGTESPFVGGGEKGTAAVFARPPREVETSLAVLLPIFRAMLFEGQHQRVHVESHPSGVGCESPQ